MAKQKIRTFRGNIDYSLLIVTLVLVAYGLIMIFSASYYMAQSQAMYQYDGLALFKKQLVGAAIGLGGMIFFMLFDYKKLIKLKYILLLVSLVLLILVFIPGAGVVEMNGSARWLRFFPGMPSLQPAEIAKFSLVIFTAATIYVNRNRMDTFRYGVMPNLLVLCVMCLLLFLQPNFSSVILLCLLVFVMIFVGGAKWWHLAALGGAGGIAGIALMLVESYRVTRVTTFLDPFSDISGDGWQIVQSLYGIGAGGVFGQGLGNGKQKFLWLPFGESDFIFSITTEELGLIGAAVLILLFVFLVYRGIKIAKAAPDMFGMLLATGIITLIGVQVIINIGVVTASIPATGVPLPFISYGNWSLMIFMSMIGILLNISRQSRQEAAKATMAAETEVQSL